MIQISKRRVFSALTIVGAIGFLFTAMPASAVTTVPAPNIPRTPPPVNFRHPVAGQENEVIAFQAMICSVEHQAGRACVISPRGEYGSFESQFAQTVQYGFHLKVNGNLTPDTWAAIMSLTSYLNANHVGVPIHSAPSETSYTRANVSNGIRFISDAVPGNCVDPELEVANLSETWEPPSIVIDVHLPLHAQGTVAAATGINVLRLGYLCHYNGDAIRASAFTYIVVKH